MYGSTPSPPVLYMERILSFSLWPNMFSKFVPTLSFPLVVSVFSLSRNQQTAPLPPLSAFLCLWVLVFNCFFDFLLGQRSKPGSHVFASSLRQATQSARTWHRGHHTWRWVSLTSLLYNLQLDDIPGADFENSLYAFGRSEKREWVQWIIITFVGFETYAFNLKLFSEKRPNLKENDATICLTMLPSTYLIWFREEFLSKCPKWRTIINFHISVITTL